MTDATEDAYDEVNRFKGALNRMYAASPAAIDDGVDGAREALFLETAMHFGHRSHAHIDVIPMDKVCPRPSKRGIIPARGTHRLLQVTTRLRHNQTTLRAGNRTRRTTILSQRDTGCRRVDHAQRTD